MWANEGLGVLELEEPPEVVVGPQSCVEHFVATCCEVAEHLRCSSQEVVNHTVKGEQSMRYQAWFL
jgi:hypothetical protein